MTYQDIIKKLESNVTSEINYTQYTKTVDGRMIPILEIRNMEVEDYIKPMEFLNPRDIKKYYGIDSISLTYSNNLRIILKNTEIDIFSKDYIVLDINELAYKEGYETIEVLAKNNSKEFDIRKWDMELEGNYGVRE